MSNVLEFACPHCSQTIRTNARYAGMQGQCPHCSKMVTVQAAAGQPSGQAIQVRAAPPARQRSSTDVNALFSGAIAAVVTVVLYAFFWAVSTTYLGQLFTARGPIPYIATFVTSWGMVMLVMKYLAVKRELSYAERELDLIPLEAGMQITPKNVDQFLQHLDGLPPAARDSILGHRVHGALEHFRSRNSVPEVQAYLSSHAEIDASTVDSGYTLLRAFIWAVPILGFIGTVMGISGAVSKLASSLDSATAQVATAEGEPAAAEPAAAEPAAGAAAGDESSTGSRMIEAMGMVTQNLSVAFDTTFVALVMAILLLFPTESLKKIEYTMLDRIENFTNESLLRRMTDEEESEKLMPEMAQLLEPVFRKHQQWLVEWQTQVAELGNSIGRDFEAHASRIKQQLEQVESGNADRVSEMVQSLASVMSEMNQSLGSLQQVSGAVTSDLQATVKTTTDLQEMLADNTANMAQLAQHWREIRAEPAGSNGKLETALDSLNHSLNRLVELAGSQAGAAPGLAAEPTSSRGFMGLFRKG